MHAPTRTRQSAADVHSRPITGQETRKDERRRPILRAARARWAKSGKNAGKMPRQFAQPMPARRREVVRVNRASRAGNRGSHPFHKLKMGPLR
jgi:hypothetical protein